MEKVARPSRVPGTSQRRPVPVVVHNPEARAVQITGDFNRWSTEGIPLRKTENGEFRVVLMLAPGEYQYRLLIDGRWADDPKAERRISNPFGSENCVLQVGEAKDRPGSPE